MTETLPCSSCGKPTDIDALDAKPDPKVLAELVAAGVENARDGAWELGEPVLECEACYGPGWVHGRA
jgi:hypothetical protein